MARRVGFSQPAMQNGVSDGVVGALPAARLACIGAGGLDRLAKSGELGFSRLSSAAFSTAGALLTACAPHPGPPVWGQHAWRHQKARRAAGDPASTLAGFKPMRVCLLCSNSANGWLDTACETAPPPRAAMARSNGATGVADPDTGQTIPPYHSAQNPRRQGRAVDLNQRAQANPYGHIEGLPDSPERKIPCLVLRVGQPAIGLASASALAQGAAWMRLAAHSTASPGRPRAGGEQFSRCARASRGIVSGYARAVGQ